ncbi:MAG TPA: succinate--CoA ligase subunit alpha [candidate division Zixibacteria bacterium]|nr:succinate--CoA ligase subunit alpha [candidate division Zixibacteria bacterium]MDD4917112.1 succinate--CoA ligase subunit alpha [candidate division Zixibacteria bacterium]MDM7972704.1 succinate--CoA ligase subunit alpha [candidate division Zixibacteria bacterium]HOD65381.1 succinate--CoA ligase subunit alpha [candidate division Zixibacteria bacterium]HOZ08604.1 succinate--CoA ligase subunit alpha [candidate division Zixibacteria bacterium]
MSILVDKNSRVLVQGITGGAGLFHTERMIAYGTNIVGGVTPGKGGQTAAGLPVFDTVAECVAATGADTSVIFLPAQFVKEAAIESIRAGLKFLVVIPEHIPIHDMLHVRREAVAHGATVIGGNTAGIITPGQANLGIMPDIAFTRGRVGTVSRSGSITYYVADTLSRTGYGETTCVGLGGDPVLGSTFDEILLKFESDPATKAVVMCGEIGGVYEERAARVIPDMRTPVLVMIGGVYAPPGKRMGHAGAIVEGTMGTAKEKLELLADHGAHPCRTFSEIPETLKKLGV